MLHSEQNIAEGSSPGKEAQHHGQCQGQDPAHRVDAQLTDRDMASASAHLGKVLAYTVSLKSSNIKGDR